MPRRNVVITFDDGFSDIYDHALPVLSARHIPAVVFATTDRQSSDWPGRHRPYPLLTRSQLREMTESGIDIGSHSRTHARLTECSSDDLWNEVDGSKKILEDMLGREIRHFCYPYGTFDERTVAAVRKAGYQTACTTVRGAVGADIDPLRLPRLTVGKRMGLFHFLRRVIL